MAISYPVLESSRWTLYSLGLGSPIATRKKWPVLHGNPIRGLDADLVYLLESTADKPAYDSSTQKLEKSVTYDTAANTAITEWSVIDLTQEEIDAKVPPHFATNDSPPILLAIEEHDQNAFSRMNSLIQLTGMTDEQSVTIKDIHSVSHNVTVAEFRTIMADYGIHCYTLFLA